MYITEKNDCNDNFFQDGEVSVDTNLVIFYK